MKARTSRGERGFALIAAVFLLVVLAALGAFAVRISMMQRHTSTLELQELRAQAALQAGIEYAAARLLATGNCNQVRDIPGMPGNFAVTFPNCNAQPYDINGVFVTIYTFDVTATSAAAYGTPEFVVRTARGVRVTT
jgi:MSHA biogenesis protein MshP